ncbi:N-acylneuraminate cytidylyltransferase [Oleidesulfovibrio alaskensis G20]|jgi:CMP-N-acetylneuraminic acid synthetase|uniref:N-acylneuraminate cytidylyltransferase n=1 Tax=Oleidesulfovibrio alaskensis (strain ATCC BAA-1058 / DSM 17464 / G20) TaxID=207559 RepID=Q30W95_OLEA2|nr:acylneuraminate cytidylyltransferase family protein [Oleidesulfovibrio alaskensis]ABB40051.1 N-acylneuraminate cytidylyltransferase [Oleidesulfovibrio alaskensis G20]MBG0773272.1 acylneuraminate cytidylyltransferase family protein [Oleidesulfovibrio alaskensis]
MRLLGLITARGGSKRVPRKNLRIVGGKPLIAWTVEEACKCSLLDSVVVSTDDEEIASVAHRFGALRPFMRPADLAGDATPHIDCVFHALESLKMVGFSSFDAVVLLQPTSPLRLAEDIEGVVNTAMKTGAEAVVSVSESVEHPYFSRLMDAQGILSPVVLQNMAYPRKQDLEKTYFINGSIYFNTVESLCRDRTFYPDRLHGYVVPLERSLQVDSDYELNIADLLLSQRSRG